MPKSKKFTTYVERKAEALRTEIAKQSEALRGSKNTLHAKQTELINNRAKMIRLDKIRLVFLKATKPTDTNNIAEAIDKKLLEEGVITLPGVKTKGRKWEENYVDTITEICRLIDDAKTIYGEKISKNEKGQLKLEEMEKKVDDLENSVLTYIRDLVPDTRGLPKKTSRHDTNVFSDYIYTDTPFQCYRER